VNLPDETELLSLFESEPILSDSDVPYFYNLVKYVFNNQSEQKIHITLQPAYDEFSIQVTDSNLKIADINLKPIDNLTIISDNINEKKIMLIGENLGVKITFQPQFKIDLKSSTE